MSQAAQVKVALITGASSGFKLPSASDFEKLTCRHQGVGKATAIALSAAGWSLTILARRKDALEETAEQCKGPKPHIEVGDICSEDFVKKAFAATVETFGKSSQLLDSQYACSANSGRLDLLFNVGQVYSSRGNSD